MWERHIGIDKKYMPTAYAVTKRSGMEINMYNDLFSIGQFTIHGYGLMIGIGVLAALIVGDMRAKKRGMDGDLIYGMTIAAVVLGFLAARILFIITDWNAFIKDPMSYITGAGFVVFGGLIGGVLTVIGYCKIKKVSSIDYMDLMAPSVALAQGFGRIGCLLAGCCYGKETTSPIGIVFAHSEYAPNGVRLLPTQIISSIGDFLIAAILIMYAKKKRKRGQVLFLWLALYSAGRFVVEFFRDDPRGNVGVLSTSQFIGIWIFLLTLVGFFVVVPFLEKGRKDSEEKTADEEKATCEDN